MVSIIAKWLPFLDLNQRPPMIPRCASNFTCPSYNGHLLTQTVKVCPTSAEADVESLTCVSYNLRKPSKLSSEQPSVACMLLDEDIWFKPKQE